MWLLVSLLSFLLGSLVAGILYSRWRGKDIRGADLPGGSGSWRQYGPAVGIGVALFDGLKGALAVALAGWLMPQDPALGAALATFFVVLGHCYPPLFGWRGGGGIATLIGALALAAPQALVGTLAAAAVFMPLYKLLLQRSVQLNVVPVTAGVVVPVLLWLAWQRGGFWAALLGSLVMGVRAAHMLQARPRPQDGSQ
ncbi:glycerol-3-phosphate acyltransferase 2 [Deinococcus piscis]|uniref:Glycerol-3-phosphate acyltransferase 2 n=1 Tax=Deinococcus piscis TaxID=394230 RepID=A0ABQ3JY46_9DEIO|nr:glycerol-3-phosphate acyltransferase [Deinococcus piscis]GHF92855.1 glycerol-3-phosphate acyltransferase 2 [Deinococcus piscis]